MKREFCSIESNLKQENKGSPWVRIVEKWTGSFFDHSIVYLNRNICIGPLLFAMTLWTLYHDKEVVSPVHKLKK